ncbi:response regulator [Pseudomaricurvus sp. HS19]|uniref:response regulator n=1 Tax=Pseudomaricurvus sp. HS19 TaxID=2692626 RepID=UPI00136B9449|nr:hypothetical protein [Pseudomaricurvus sp. HS19]MYM62713.1 hypothetical protein [Pseudomaricurvus sp. HS19]
MRILHVEDSAQQQATMRNYLRSLSWPLEYHTCNSLEAMQQLWARDPNFDLVVASLGLLESGHNPLLPELAPTPVVVITRYNDESLEQELLQSGALDVIATPELSPATLKRLLRYLQERRQLQEQLQRARDAGLDPITGLHTGNHAQRELERLIEGSQRHGARFSLALLAPRGDLLPLVNALQYSLRKGDLGARLDNDRLLLLFPNTVAEAAVQCLRRTQEQLAAISPEGKFLAALGDYNEGSAEACLQQLEEQLGRGEMGRGEMGSDGILVNGQPR